MARDILAIPATGPGIEKVFNIACNVCHFQCSVLGPDTIWFEMVKYYHDYKEIKEVETTWLSNLDTKYFETTTLKEIEQDL